LNRDRSAEHQLAETLQPPHGSRSLRCGGVSPRAEWTLGPQQGGSGETFLTAGHSVLRDPLSQCELKKNSLYDSAQPFNPVTVFGEEQELQDQVWFALSPALTPSAFSSEMNRGSSPRFRNPQARSPSRRSPGARGTPTLSHPKRPQVW
jgi:hypothetical protein